MYNEIATVTRGFVTDIAYISTYLVYNPDYKEVNEAQFNDMIGVALETLQIVSNLKDNKLDNKWGDENDKDTLTILMVSVANIYSNLRKYIPHNLNKTLIAQYNCYKYLDKCMSAINDVDRLLSESKASVFKDQWVCKDIAMINAELTEYSRHGFGYTFNQYHRWMLHAAELLSKLQRYLFKLESAEIINGFDISNKVSAIITKIGGIVNDTSAEQLMQVTYDDNDILNAREEFLALFKKYIGRDVNMLKDLTPEVATMHVDPVIN